MKTIFSLALGLISINVNAQATFSFSGLQWGQNIDQVATQLTKSGLPTSSPFIAKAGCMLGTACYLEFSGQGINGMADFQAGRLVKVTLFSGGASHDRYKRLERSYGPPTRRSIPNKGDIFGSQTTWFWESPNGELIELQRDGSTSYKSSTLNRASQDAGVKF